MYRVPPMKIPYTVDYFPYGKRDQHLFPIALNMSIDQNSRGNQSNFIQIICRDDFPIDDSQHVLVVLSPSHYDVDTPRVTRHIDVDEDDLMMTHPIPIL